MSTYNVVLVDDHTMFREGLRKIIEKIEDVKISGEAGDGLELLQLLKDSSPDLVILDLSMPNMGGLEAIKEIKKNLSTSKNIGSDYVQGKSIYSAGFERRSRWISVQR